LKLYDVEWTAKYGGEDDCNVSRLSVEAKSHSHAMAIARRRWGIAGTRGLFRMRKDRAEWRPYRIRWTIVSTQPQQRLEQQMNDKQYAQGLRARGLKGFRWMHGMGADAPGSRDIVRVIDVESDPRLPKLPCMWETDGYLRGKHNDWEWPDHLVPDFSDLATYGCLVGLVRERFGQMPNSAGDGVPATVFTSFRVTGWNVGQRWELRPGCHRWQPCLLPEDAPTEIDALLNALALGEPSVDRPIAEFDYVRHRVSGVRLDVTYIDDGSALCRERLQYVPGVPWREPRFLKFPLEELELDMPTAEEAQPHAE
jgi:hypothetical protein